MNNSNILVVGGAGYIGSHMVRCLTQAGFNPIVLDNLSSGHRDAVQEAKFIQGDMADSHLLDKIFSEENIAAVMHFASFIQVSESVLHPGKYYQNNVAGTLQLLQSMVKHRVKHFVFSSTAAVYGEPRYTPLDEQHELNPLNPYGQSKKIVEQILSDFSCAYDFNFISLRYFNAAGADPSGELCERHEPESHLIPLILQTALGLRKSITVYGRDYPTPDGTCIRDYIHVMDLCSAHLRALEMLFSGKKRGIYNLGTGLGYSVQQVIDTAREITGRSIAITEGERRPGDAAVLVADPRLALTKMNWVPCYSDLRQIIKDAWVSLVELRGIHWNGKKPKGGKLRPKIKGKKTVAEFVLQDRR